MTCIPGSMPLFQHDVRNFLSLFGSAPAFHFLIHQALRLFVRARAVVVIVEIVHLDRLLHTHKDGCPVVLREGAAGNMPDAPAAAAATEILAGVKDAGENELVLLLISGGGSALLPLPAPGVCGPAIGFIGIGG